MKNLSGRIKRLYKYVTHHLSGALLSVTVIFFLGAIVGYLTFSENEVQVMVLMERMMELFPEKDPMTLTSLSYSSLLMTNGKWIGALFLLGCIPFLYGSVMLLAICGVMVGIAAAYYHILDIALRVFLMELFPHGMIQFPCLLLASALGMRLCTQLTRKIIGRNKTWYWQKELLYMIKVFIYILLPLVLISSFLEMKLTPYIVHYFGW